MILQHLRPATIRAGSWMSCKMTAPMRPISLTFLRASGKYPSLIWRGESHGNTTSQSKSSYELDELECNDPWMIDQLEALSHWRKLLFHRGLHLLQCGISKSISYTRWRVRA